MHKSAVLVFLIVFGTMPLQTSAQASVPAVDLAQIEKQIQELEQQKTQMIMEQDPTELMFED